MTYQAIFLLLEVVIPFQGKDSCATTGQLQMRPSQGCALPAEFYPAKPRCHCCLSLPPQHLRRRTARGGAMSGGVAGGRSEAEPRERAGPGAAAGGCRRCRSPLELQVELCRRAASRKPHGPSSAWPRRRLPGCSVEWPGADGGGAAAGRAAGGRPARSAAGKAAALPAERTRRPGLRGAARRGVDFLRAGQDSAGPWPRRPRLR